MLSYDGIRVLANELLESLEGFFGFPCELRAFEGKEGFQYRFRISREEDKEALSSWLVEALRAEGLPAESVGYGNLYFADLNFGKKDRGWVFYLNSGTLDRVLISSPRYQLSVNLGIYLLFWVGEPMELAGRVYLDSVPPGTVSRRFEEFYNLKPIGGERLFQTLKSFCYWEIGASGDKEPLQLARSIERLQSDSGFDPYSMETGRPFRILMANPFVRHRVRALDLEVLFGLELSFLGSRRRG